jgi:hypothetical protein
LRTELTEYCLDIFKYTKELLIFDLIENDTEIIKDKIFLYEAIGILVTNEKISKELRKEITKEVISPLYKILSDLFENEIEYLNDKHESIILNIINSVQFFSKGILIK